MDIPTTAVDAARVLVALADGNPFPGDDVPDAGWLDRYNPTPVPRDGDEAPVDTLTAWRALTPRDHIAARVARARALANPEVDRDLPELVVTPVAGLVANPPRARKRPRFTVPALDAALPVKRPATVRDAHALTLGALSARLAADRVEAWIPDLRAAESRQARRELVAYRAYAASAVDLFPSAFAWLDGVELVHVEAPSIVSAHLRVGRA